VTVRYLLAGPCLALLAHAATVHAGKLDDVRDAVQDDSSDSESGSDSDDDDDSLWDDDCDDLHDCDHYASGSSGGIAKTGPLGLSLRLRTEYAWDVDNVHQPAVHAVLLFPWLMGMECGWTFLLESVEDGVDHLSLGYAHVLLRLFSNDALDVRTGLGGRWMVDGGRVDGGFSYTLAMDVMPARYLVFSASGDLGTLGNAFVAHGRLTVGGRYRGLVLYAGYDVQQIGDVLFHGPVAGLQLWY
jgi:hypothetical protein